MVKRPAKLEETLPQKILHEAQRQGYEELLMQGRLVVGVSGGADSLALLYSLIALRGPAATKSIHVAHLNHGFRGPEGDADAEFVAGVASQNGLDSTILHVDVPALAKRLRLSPEDAARRARYSFLARLAEEQEALVAVAHTADDQAETVLMSILRGSGLAGIAGMQPVATLRFASCFDGAEGSERELAVRVFRPMLSIWRDEVERYCLDLGLTPRTDATNALHTYLRNRVRLDLLPHIRSQYSPAIKEHLAHLATIASGEESLLEEYADEVWQSIGSYSPSEAVLRIDRSRFSALHVAMQRRIVRRAISEMANTLEGITYQHISSVVDALTGRAGSKQRLHLPHGLALEVTEAAGIISHRKGKGELDPKAVPSSNDRPLIQPELEMPVTAGKRIELESGWVLTGEIVPIGKLANAPGELVAHFDRSELDREGELILRTRHPGDTIQPLGMAGRKSLQDLYVDAKIPRALRNYIPVLARTGTNDVLWIPGPGGRRSSMAATSPTTTQVLQLTFTRDDRSSQ